jgi:hypothetical protein
MILRMSKRTILTLSIVAAMLPQLRHARAQVQAMPAQTQPQVQTPSQTPAPPSEDQQAIMQTMRQMMMNMRAKGIDPQELFQQIQSGADPADIQQQLIDEGVIDKQMIATMQGAAQRMILTRIKEQLGATDQEWAALLPRVQKVLTAKVNIDQRGQAGGARGGMERFLSAENTELTAALKELRAAVKDPTASPEVFASKMAVWRSANQRAINELTDAQSELASVLTVRQESVLVVLGLLP